MILTTRQLAILNHIVTDGQSWADNAIKEEHVLIKIAKYESAYDEAVAKGSYKTRKQRDEVEAKAKQDKYDNVSYSEKRYREYARLNQLELISDDSINGTTTHKDAILAVKAKYPKPE